MYVSMVNKKGFIWNCHPNPSLPQVDGVCIGVCVITYCLAVAVFLSITLK